MKYRLFLLMILFSNYLFSRDSTYIANGWITCNKFYVDTNGNDANSGLSPATAWKTIAKVNGRTFIAGDSIMLKKGETWREQLTITSSGVFGNPITICAYGSGAKPILNGADIITTWVNVGTNTWSSSYSLVRGMVVIDDTIYSQVGSVAALTPKTYCITGGQVSIWSATNPNSRKSEVSKRDFGVYGLLKHHYVIKGLDCRYAAGGGVGMDGNSGHFDGSVVVDSCNFYANRLWGCMTRDGHENDLFKNSNATYNGNGFYTWISDNCTMSHDSSAHSIYYADTDGGAMQSYRGSNWLCEYCYSYDDNDAIHIDAGGLPCNATIRYNKAFNTKFGSPNTPDMGVGNLAAGGVVQFYYNLLVNGSSNAFECYSKVLGQVQFYNNTIFLQPGTGTDGTIYLIYGDNFIFKNNIITREGASRVLFTVFNPLMTTNDYNSYWNFPPVYSALFYYQAYYGTLPAWQSGTGQDIHSQVSDPLFVNRNSDWKLQAGSPCINKGVNVGLTKDIDGKLISGLPDMGCYEF